MIGKLFKVTGEHPHEGETAIITELNLGYCTLKNENCDFGFYYRDGRKLVPVDVETLEEQFNENAILSIQEYQERIKKNNEIIRELEEENINILNSLTKYTKKLNK